MKLSPDEGKGEPSLGARKRPQLSSWTARKLMSSQPRPATAQPPAPAWEEAQRDDWVLQEFARTTTARPGTDAAMSSTQPVKMEKLTRKVTSGSRCSSPRTWGSVSSSPTPGFLNSRRAPRQCPQRGHTDRPACRRGAECFLFASPAVP